MADAPTMAWSTLNCLMKSTVASPTIPPSSRRTIPPADITSMPSNGRSRLTTFRLLVMTVNPTCPERLRATCSVVVPMFTISEASFGISAAARRPMAALPSAASCSRAA